LGGFAGLLITYLIEYFDDGFRNGVLTEEEGIVRQVLRPCGEVGSGLIGARTVNDTDDLGAQK